MTRSVLQPSRPYGHAADLASVMARDAPAFALLYRPRSTDHSDRIDILVGDAQEVERLEDLPLPPVRPGVDRHDLLALIPYRQLVERGFACHDDARPLVALEVRGQGSVSVVDALRVLPDRDPVVSAGGSDIGDEEYGDIVRRVVADDIGRGAGSTFVIRRSFQATITNHSSDIALSIFRRLLLAERGTYWTFVVHCGGRTIVGATPERHVSLQDGIVKMNPISGTYRYPESGPTVDGVLRFLADRKEAEELYMVVDEELKMMARVCDLGGRLIGPRLKEMARLAHTEYAIEGRSGLDVRQILRDTMFAPTVTGSPLESACRVIARHERSGRGYYAGALALIGQRRGRRTLDASILIRTADIDADGRLEIGVGATLVRHSNPDAEVAETRAKAAALLAAIGPDLDRRNFGGVAASGDSGGSNFAEVAPIKRALAARNVGLSRFWLDPPDRRRHRIGELSDRRILVVDAEDMFTAMLAHQVRALGPEVAVRPYDGHWRTRDHDVVIVGPGPGDPRDTAQPRIAALRRLTERLIEEGTPFLSVCLGHQILATVLGLTVRRRSVPAQGLRRDVDVDGRCERVGFYNTFAAFSAVDEFVSGVTGTVVRVARDRASGEVHGLSMPGARSIQFHAESVLTEHGPRILGDLLTALVADHVGVAR
jgi:phenazine biosynthesis protein phzE